jgi:DNA primase
MIASIAAEASLSQHYAPVSTSGLEWSDTQRAALRLIHPYPPVLAFDGDHSGLGANLARGRDFLADGIETVVTIWPDQQDPADYLREHGPCGLAAVTRKGCLQPGPELRPRHIGEIIAQAALLDRVSRSPAVERALTDIVALADLLPVRGANRYLVAVAAATPSQLRGHLDAVAAIAERRTTEVQSSRAARQGNELELSPNKTLGGAAL